MGQLRDKVRAVEMAAKKAVEKAERWTAAAAAATVEWAAKQQRWELTDTATGVSSCHKRLSVLKASEMLDADPSYALRIQKKVTAASGHATFKCKGK